MPGPMTFRSMASSSVRYSLMETGSRWLLSLRKKSISMARIGPASAALGPRHEHQPLEEMHVLLVLEQRAVQGRDEGLAVLRVQRLGRDVLGEKELEPVEQLRGRGFLLEARHLAHLEKH